MRIAFLTTEFPTEHGSGGLGSYLGRMTQALYEAGHTPEVFVYSSQSPATLHYGPITVHRARVLRSRHVLILRLMKWFHGPTAGKLRSILRRVFALSRVFELRSHEVTFDAVQCPNNFALALAHRGRTQSLIIRLSSDRILWNHYDGNRAMDVRLPAFLERLALRKATAVYAPSQFLADYISERRKKTIACVRPPVGEVRVADCLPASLLPEEWGTAPRYFVHFGKMGLRKGSDLVLAALELAWKTDPEIQLVNVGPDIAGLPWLDEHLHTVYTDRRVHTITELEHPKLMRLVRSAVASVLPSRVDNLPNTVIESLLVHTPVIGTDGASIDELVDHGLTGALVPYENVPALSDALLAAWRGNGPWNNPIDGLAGKMRSLSTERVVNDLIGFIRSHSRSLR